MKKNKLAVLSLLAVSAIGLASCSGEQGPRGLEGPKGEKGDKGDQGLKGETGNEGPAGPVGPKGDQGPKGEKGDKGDRGETGATGEKGEKGDTGATGEKGEKGDKGDKGDTGASGKTAWSNTILPSEGGYVVPSVGSAVVGSEITFTIKANAGYTFNSLVLNDKTYSRAECDVVSDTTYTYTTTMKENGYVVQANFSNGTQEDDPIIITSASDLKLALSGDTANKYYKLDSSIKTIDCTVEELFYLEFSGNLDGNGVTLTNLKKSLFYNLGSGKDDSVTIKNLNVETNARSSLVFTAYAKEITFENVKLSGVIEGMYNVGGFVNYGPRNMDKEGFDYTLNFKNCSSDAVIISKAAAFGVLVGHPYPGDNHKLTLNIDSATYDGIKGAKGYLPESVTKNNALLYSAWAYIGNNLFDVYKDGTKLTDVEKKETLASDNVTLISKLNPTKKDDNKYYVDKAEGAVSYKVWFQMYKSSVDEDGKDADKNITNSYPYISDTAFAEGETSVELFSEISQFKLEEGDFLLYKYDKTSKLVTLKTSLNENLKYFGSIKIAVSQYDANGFCVSNGEYTIVKVAKENALAYDAAWVVDNK